MRVQDVVAAALQNEWLHVYILSSLLFLATSAASTIIERKEISYDLIFFSFLRTPVTRIRLLCPTMPKDTDFKDIIYS